MTQKLGTNIFESLFKMAYEPFYVDAKHIDTDEKNLFPTIYSAISSANYNSLIKINQGLYVQNIQIKTSNIKIQASQPSTNAIIISNKFPSCIVALNNDFQRISLQSLRFAHLCQQNYRFKYPNLKKLKQNQYRQFRVQKGNIDSCIFIKKGTLYIDQCKFSLITQKDTTKLIPSIVVEKQGTLIMTRCQIRGEIGAMGILVKGGKVIIKQSHFKNCAIGILAVGPKQTSIIIKNSFFQNCLQGIVLAGPFQGSLQNNIITQSKQNGLNILTGNKCKILNNQIKQCNVGIKLQNCCSVLMKNTITKCKKYGIQCYSKKNLQCWPLIKFNFIHQNQKGGIYLNGNGNKTQIFNNQLHFNNKVGIKIEKSASPHVLLNNIKNTLGVGLHILPSSTAFIEKNHIVGSLKCNVVIQGPNNIGNYMYNNTIQQSRGQGLFLLNSQNFLINNNTIRKNNNNGILCITSVVTFQQNIISQNKNNGILLVQDNDIQLTQNQIMDNKKSGLVIRHTSKGQIKKNWFINNQIEIVVENNTKGLENIQEENNFGRKLNNEEIQEKNKQNLKKQSQLNKNNSNGNNNYVKLQQDKRIDIRIPKNYYYLCEIM